MRIIPARAGFTRRHQRAHHIVQDHPRSRGVYPTHPGRTWPRSGSSPLARGLHKPHGWANSTLGIIPARAGFTPVPSSGTQGNQDHPRSRGVYDWTTAAVGADQGSSPLARGLRGQGALHRQERRIIPARAGFTARPGAGHRAHRDHPRSRGVYPASQSMHHMTRGSSPLARGLHFRAESGGAESGIIPARAGFTGRPGRRAQGVRDHPRSRGVYHCRDASRSRAVGSSPLARGLRSTDGPIASLSGIIPARAGFTPASSRRRPARRDHPRSRGVYSGSCSCRAGTQGSSPLARGLRRGRARGRENPRIIPARAGFTT